MRKFNMEGELIGRVFNYFEKAGVAAIELDDSLKLGDTIRVIGSGSDFTEIVDSIQIDGKNIEHAKKGDRVGIKISERAGKGAKVYRVK
jgi:U32 family peptidase